MEIAYYNPLTDKNNVVYSCDMVRLKLELKKNGLDNISRYLSNETRLDIKAYDTNFKEYRYKYLYTIDYGVSTMVIGLVFNGTAESDKYSGFIEFNPNKTMSACQNDLNYIRDNCWKVQLVRYDIAFDLPYSRELVYLQKDKRRYQMYMNSKADKTEYLSCRNKPGFTKLYNKTIECKLDRAVTRLEITMSDTKNIFRDCKNYIPKIMILNPQQNLLDMQELNSTQQTLVKAMKDSDNKTYLLSQLNYKLRKKIEPYITGVEGTTFEPDLNLIYKLVSMLRELEV